MICFAAPLLLAAGVLARVEFTNLHNTPHPSYAPDAVGGYALHYTLTTHPLDTLGEAVQTLAAEERRQRSNGCGRLTTIVSARWS